MLKHLEVKWLLVTLLVIWTVTAVMFHGPWLLFYVTMHAVITGALFYGVIVSEQKSEQPVMVRKSSDDANG